MDDPIVMEALAMLKAIIWARDMCFHEIILEGDACNIISQVNSITTDLSTFGLIIEDIKTERKWFHSSQFTFIPKEGNRVAHELAQFGLSLSTERFWVDEALVWLHDYLTNDCNDTL